MSRFLEDFAEFIKNNDGRVFSVAEIIGNENPEKIIVTPNNASQNAHSGCFRRYALLTRCHLLP